MATDLPKAFIWRRLHSLTGLFLALYLIEHLLVNSQAALYFGEDGAGFVRAVNSIHELPFLTFIEIFLLGVPIVIHMVWGVVYLRTGEQNAYGNPGNKPYYHDNGRNRAYTWQRITSWVLLVGIIAHVVHMRFIEYPTSAKVGEQKEYLVLLDQDEGLESLAKRLDVKLYDSAAIEQLRAGNASDRIEWLKILDRKPPAAGQVVAAASSFGMAELLMVRETFKMPFMIALYTIFVLSACYHGFNGVWTFMISWGVTPVRSQGWMLVVATTLMAAVAFLGLSAIFGTYWINLKQ